MNIFCEMVDVLTGEILAKRSVNYTLNFGLSSDAGFKFLHSWLESSVRGVRNTDHKEIQVTFKFSEEKESLPLF